MRGGARIAAAAAGLLLLLAAPAAAAPSLPEAVEVARDAVNLRAAPSTRARRVGRARRGDRLAVVDREGGWYQVARPGGGRAWVFARLVRPARPSVEPGSRVRPRGHYANLRARPSRRARKVGRMERGESLEALERRGEWIRVRTREGGEAWVFEGVVHLLPPDPAAPLIAELRRDYPGVVRWGRINDVQLDHYHEAVLDLVVEPSWHFLAEGQRLALLRRAARGFADLLRSHPAYRRRYHNRPLVRVRDPSNTIVGTATPREVRLHELPPGRGG